MKQFFLMTVEKQSLGILCTGVAILWNFSNLTGSCTHSSNKFNSGSHTLNRPSILNMHSLASLNTSKQIGSNQRLKQIFNANVVVLFGVAFQKVESFFLGVLWVFVNGSRGGVSLLFISKDLLPAFIEVHIEEYQLLHAFIIPLTLLTSIPGMSNTFFKSKSTLLSLQGWGRDDWEGRMLTRF